VRSVGVFRRFALQSQCLAHDSLFFARTRNSFGRTGNFIRRNSGSPIPLGGIWQENTAGFVFRQNEAAAPISLGRGTVRKAVEFLCIRKIIYFIPQ
jgi:hypothetical protein